MLNDNIFRFSLKRFIVMMLPSAIRKAKLANLIFCLLTPLQTIYITFFARRKNALMQAKYDSGKGNIERMLNILYMGSYSATNKPIYIENGSDDIENVNSYVYDANGLKKKDAIIVSDTNEEDRSYLNAEQPQVAFIIYIPSSVSYRINEIRNRTAMYVLPGMSFNIKIY